MRRLGPALAAILLSGSAIAFAFTFKKPTLKLPSFGSGKAPWQRAKQTPPPRKPATLDAQVKTAEAVAARLARDGEKLPASTIVAVQRSLLQILKNIFGRRAQRTFSDVTRGDPPWIIALKRSRRLATVLRGRRVLPYWTLPRDLAGLKAMLDAARAGSVNVSRVRKASGSRFVSASTSRVGAVGLPGLSIACRGAEFATLKWCRSPGNCSETIYSCFPYKCAPASRTCGTTCRDSSGCWTGATCRNGRCTLP